MRVYGRHLLKWLPDGRAWKLCCYGRGEPVLHVVPDEVYPGMWRVRRPDGTWARDGGIAIALGILNRGQDMEEPREVAPPMRLLAPWAIQWPWAAEGLSTGFLQP
jgi:hypothetical protein